MEAVSIIQVRGDSGLYWGGNSGGAKNDIHSLIPSTTQQDDSYF